jgi:hypothetical protein
MNDFFDALDNAKEHAADMAAMEDDANLRDYAFVEKLSEPDARHYANAKLELLRDAIYNVQVQLRDNTLADSKATRAAARELHDSMGAIRVVMGILADKQKARQAR